MTVQGKSCLGEVSISPEIQWGIVLFESRLPTQGPAPANNITQGLETTGNGAPLEDVLPRRDVLLTFLVVVTKFLTALVKKGWV